MKDPRNCYHVHISRYFRTLPDYVCDECGTQMAVAEDNASEVQDLIDSAVPDLIQKGATQEQVNELLQRLGGS